MKISFFKYVILSGLLGTSAVIFAQDKKDEATNSALNEEIEIVRPYKPILADAVKIKINPDLTDNKPFKPQLTYSILDKKLELNTNIAPLQSRGLTAERETILKNNYVKVGAGSLNTGLAEIYLNTGKDEGLQAGVFIRHLSQQGSINKQQFSNQQIGVFGRSIYDQITINGKVSYDRKATYFYGISPSLPVPSADPAKQRFNIFEADGELMSNYDEDSEELKYAVKANVYSFSNIFKGRERAALISAGGSKALNKFDFGLQASADFTGAEDSLYSISNTILRANPYVKYGTDAVLLNVGLNLVQETGLKNRLNVLPAVSAEFQIKEDYARLFTGINGDVLKTSLRDMSLENPYLNNNVIIQNAVEKSNIYGGVKGNAGSSFGYKVMVSYKTIENLPLFMNDSLNVNRFNIIYDQGKSNTLGFEGEISIKKSDMFSLTSKIQFANYNMATEEAWFKPGIRLLTNVKGQITKKLSLDGEVLFNGETSAKVISLIPIRKEQIIMVKSFIDFSMGTEYRINNKLGLYIRANNILGTQYQQYLYYQKLGLNIFGGVNFSF
ncbi:MAG: hypothetical protein WBP45_01560 [Daejeonella sp.]